MATASAPTLQAFPDPIARELDVYEPARFSADEFLRMGELGLWNAHRLELVDGELVEKPMHGMLHALLHAEIIRLLATVVPPDCVGMGVLSIRLTDRTVRDFDAGWVVRGTPKASSVSPTAVRLAVEVSVTTLSVDLEQKSLEYARGGVPTYWVVDGVGEVTHVMTAPGPEGYGDRRVVRFGERLTAPGGGSVVVALDD